MNWDALGAIGESIGAAGVIASLLYLAVQVRANTRAAAVEAKLESTRLLTEFTDQLIRSPELNDLLLRGRKSLDSLSPDEYYRFSNMCLKAFWYFSAGYFQFRKGTLRETDWFEIQAVVQFWIRSDGGQDWWAKVGRAMYGPDFIAYIESEIADLDSVNP